MMRGDKDAQVMLQPTVAAWGIPKLVCDICKLLKLGFGDPRDDRLYISSLVSNFVDRFEERVCVDPVFRFQERVDLLGGGSPL
jgi:hypothetical protein